MTVSAPPSSPPASPRNFRRAMVGLSIVAILTLAYLLRGVLVPLFLAFLLAYALDPWVDRLEALKVPRALGAMIVMASIAGLFTVLMIFAIPMFTEEIAATALEFPAQLTRLQARAEPWMWAAFHVKLPHTMNDFIKAYGDKLPAPTEMATALTTAIFGTLGFVGVILSALIVPVFALYLLIDFDRIVAYVRELVPRRFVSPVSDVALQIHKTLGGYVRGQITANIVLAALYASGLSLVDIRLAVPIGVLTGMLAFVPYIGFATGFLLALAMSILDWHGVGQVMGVVVVMGVVQLADGMLITPRIVGRSVGLAPLEVLVTMMCAGTLFGFLGVLLAVPLGAVVKILVQRGVKAYLASEYYKRQRPRSVP